MKNFQETSILSDIMKECTNERFSWELSVGKDTTQMLFEVTAMFLGEKKSKTEPQAFALKDVRGNFHFGAIVTFIPSDEDESKGSYNLAYTFDENDIAESGAKVYEVTDMLFRHMAYTVGARDHGIEFKSDTNTDFMARVFCITADCIKNYMVQNIKIDPQIELEDYFTIRAELDGEKVYCNITPSALLKQHVKDDASIESAE